MHPINCALVDNFVSDSNNITMTANTALFILGGLVFLVAFSWFKAAALKLYSTSINKDAYDNKNEWFKLLRVFLVDWLVCILGALLTGIIFVSLFNLFH